jgi:DnaJ like chaperone protein
MRARDGGHRTAMTEQDAEDPDAILGVSRDTSDDAIRAAWRQLMRDNHPDFVASKGVPADFIARAGEKLARINAAWDRLGEARARPVTPSLAVDAAAPGFVSPRPRPHGGAGRMAA